MQSSFLSICYHRFLGNSPVGTRKRLSPSCCSTRCCCSTAGPFITGWIIIGEFIFTLAMALKCYPLQSGGIIAFEVVLIGMTGPAAVFDEIRSNLEVILLLVFMVAGIYFMKPLLMFIFSKVFVKIRSKSVLALLFCSCRHSCPPSSTR